MGAAREQRSLELQPKLSHCVRVDDQPLPNRFAEVEEGLMNPMLADEELFGSPDRIALMKRSAALVRFSLVKPTIVPAEDAGVRRSVPESRAKRVLGAQKL